MFRRSFAHHNHTKQNSISTRRFVPSPRPIPDELKVLVINAGKEMAKEITHELTVALTGCSIMYAPSIELACWILKRRHIDLVVSSSILPDGHVSKIESVLAKLSHKPDVVVVGKVGEQYKPVFNRSDYQFTTFRKLTDASAPPLPKISSKKLALKPVKNGKTISTLGADLRNDLNNPLQEIVAMVFVAKNSPSSTPLTAQALEAIEKAAHNMASIVNRLEDRIRTSLQK